MRIELSDIEPTRKESRPLRFGWGLVPGLQLLPTVIIAIGLWVTAAIAIEYGAPLYVLPMAVGGTLVAAGLCGALTTDLLRSAHRKSPYCSAEFRWIIDDEGLNFISEIYRTSYHWQAFKDVRDQHDRFLFMLTPTSNIVLPKRYLEPEQIEALRSVIAEQRASGKLGAGASGGVD